MNTKTKNNSKEQNLEIANTIYLQIGGAKAGLMAGMKGLCAIENGLRFQFKGSRKANLCTIVLNGLDLYTVKFYKLSMKKGCQEVKCYYDVYFDQLIPIFEEFTGLYLHL